MNCRVLSYCLLAKKEEAKKSDSRENSAVKEKNAIILAHYDVPDEVQAVADYIGDSFFLSKVARETEADIIVLCGVSFMGESVTILNPDKKVLMPDLQADCAMAHMVELDKIAEYRGMYEDLAVVCYINSTAEIKMHPECAKEILGLADYIGSTSGIIRFEPDSGGGTSGTFS